MGQKMIAMLLLLAATGCSGGGGTQAQATPGASASAARVFTSDQLRQALLTQLPTYQRAGEPDSGPYGTLKAIRNFDQLQSQVTLDKPGCAEASAAFNVDPETQSAPAALTTFARASGQTVTETLVAVPLKEAEEQVGYRVPPRCRTFRAKVGDQWSTHQVIESTALRYHVADGSRTVGLVTMSGRLKVTMWFVVFQASVGGRSYLGTVTIYGAGATRAEAENLGRQAHAQAQRILPPA